MNRWRCQNQSAPATISRKAATANTSRRRMSTAKPIMAIGCMPERFSSSGTCGFSTHQASTPVSVTFTSDLTNCIAPSRPKTRLKPAAGESLLRSKASFSGVNMKPVWMRFAATPAAQAAANTAAIGGAAARIAM